VWNVVDDVWGEWWCVDDGLYRCEKSSVCMMARAFAPAHEARQYDLSDRIKAHHDLYQRFNPLQEQRAVGGAIGDYCFDAAAAAADVGAHVAVTVGGDDGWWWWWWWCWRRWWC